MNLLKSLKLKKYMKISLSILIWILFLWIISILWYSYIYEQDKIAIDRYNFEQLEKAKPILEKLPQKDKKIFSPKMLNDLYGANIQTIKNCYYISNSNWKYPYIFWFQLESLMYKVLYFWENYAYPKYDKPVDYFCWWSKYCRDDRIFGGFIWTISWPCDSYWDEQH